MVNYESGCITHRGNPPSVSRGPLCEVTEKPTSGGPVWPVTLEQARERSILSTSEQGKDYVRGSAHVPVFNATAAGLTA